MSVLDPLQIRSALAAIDSCSYRLIGLRPSGSNGACSLLPNRNATDLAYALEEATSIYPHTSTWEIVAADDDVEPDPRFGPDGRKLPANGTLFRDPLVIAFLSLN